MNHKIAVLGAATLLLIGSPARADLLPNNFWANSTFESGTDLDQTTGTPLNWIRGGDDTTICQVITNNSVSSSHSLAIIDTDVSFGEWYSDVTLSGHASPGDTLKIQWFEMYNTSADIQHEMRLTVRFLDSLDNSVSSDTSFVAKGNSAGWLGTIENSTFTKRNASLTVPLGAVKMRCALNSGGLPDTTGVMIIDDLSVAKVPTLLPGNFWVNSTFELGTDLEQPTGTPANWNRGGSDTSICQVITNNSVSPSHSLAVIDTNGFFGEWYSDVSLIGHANPGDGLDVQWFEMYNLSGPEMRLTVRFLNASDISVVPDTHFTTGTNTSSAGWVSTIANSTFTKRNEELLVPVGAVKMRCALVSGGPSAITGVMVIDDLSVAIHPPTVLAGNFFPNPTFEAGEQLDNPALAAPAGIWLRGGQDSSINQVITNNSVSPSHSLALLDNNPSSYGEWYGFLTLTPFGVAEGDVLDLQWFQLYNVSSEYMRLSFLFQKENGEAVSASYDFKAPTNGMGGQSPGWTGSISNSPFERVSGRLLVPAEAAKLRVNFASGGSSTPVGLMVIDDLSIRISKLVITSITAEVDGFNLTWDSMPSKFYTVQFASSLGSPTVWTSLITDLAGDPSLSNMYLDTVPHAGKTGFYRVLQQP